MSNLPARRSLLGALSTDRAVGKQLASIQTGAFLERAEDETRRQLVESRMSDIGMATRHAFNEGDDIVADLVSRIERNPHSANALMGLAEDGVHGLRRELRRLSEGR